MPSQRVRPQIGLLTMLLVLSCVAAGLAIGLSRRKIEETNALLAVLRPFKQELVVVDPSKITAVRRKPRDLFDCVWDVHIPEGKVCRLMYAGVEIAELASGRRVVEWDFHLSHFRDPAPRTGVDLIVVSDIVFATEEIRWQPMGREDGGLYLIKAGDVAKRFLLAKERKPAGFGADLLWIEQK